MAAYIITIDASDLKNKVEFLRKRLSPERANRVLKRVCRETGKQVRPILRRQIPREYYATDGWINSNVKRMRMGGGSGGINCTIPIIGQKGTIGGRFRASGGAAGWVPRGAHYRITARIVKGEESRLPQFMSSYGGYPPFRNTSAKRLNGAVFTRLSKNPFPIERVSGIGVPQMPMNRAQPMVEAEIHAALSSALDGAIGELI